MIIFVKVIPIIWNLILTVPLKIGEFFICLIQLIWIMPNLFFWKWDEVELSTNINLEWIEVYLWIKYYHVYLFVYCVTFGRSEPIGTLVPGSRVLVVEES